MPPPESAGAAMGTDSESEMRDAFERMLSEARENGMSVDGLTKARDLLAHFRDIFRIRLGDDPPAFFSVCRKYNLKVHAKKTSLFSTSATFCGRVFDRDGMRFHPRKFEALKTMQCPEFARDLPQFTSALNYIRTSIPNYAETASPLLKLLEDCYTEVGGRTKKKLANFSLTAKWGTNHQRSFDRLKEHLADQLQLSFPKRDYDVCKCTDASETHLSGVFTQVPKLSGTCR